jgi:hypothetical protein
MRTYSHTKSVMMALAYEQAQRWRPTGITVNVAYPGGADTPMTRAMTPAGVPMPMRARVAAVQADHGSRPARAGRPVLDHAGLGARLAGVTGTYVNTRSKPARWPADVLDPALRGRLWRPHERSSGCPPRTTRWRPRRAERRRKDGGPPAVTPARRGVPRRPAATPPGGARASGGRTCAAGASPRPGAGGGLPTGAVPVVIDRPAREHPHDDDEDVPCPEPP